MASHLAKADPSTSVLPSPQSNTSIGPRFFIPSCALQATGYLTRNCFFTQILPLKQWVSVADPQLLRNAQLACRPKKGVLFVWSQIFVEDEKTGERLDGVPAGQTLSC